MTHDNNMMSKYKYPHIGDKYFQKKIYLKKEFNHKYFAETGNIKKMDSENLLCGDGDFVLSSHQEFIKNFIHPTTPYNGIILYHGMGTGKTCSAIGIAEQFRKNYKYDTSFKKILIVASPNVQENFKQQLFDPDKLVKKKGLWKLDGCVGISLLYELKEYNIHDMNKEDLIHKINQVIKKSYLFLGYEKLANIIQKVISGIVVSDELKKKKLIIERLSGLFDNSLIIIDEAHNIRINGGSNEKKTANMLELLTTYVKRNKILLLTGTPMYNDAKEIIFLLNILRKNDGRSKILSKNVFDKPGNFLLDENNVSIGEKELIEKASGYISHVRGENPYRFPFKIYPRDYKCKFSISNFKYPTVQHNGEAIKNPISFLDLYVNELSEFQKKGYDSFKSRTKTNPPIKINDNNSGYKELQESLFALNICYPKPGIVGEYMTGKTGLASVVTKTDGGNFSYIDKGNRLFDLDVIGTYSKKIESILEQIKNSEGIILIYSQYLDSGLIPIALALEEMGMSRIDNNDNLFSRGGGVRKKLNVNTMKPKEVGTVDFQQARYAMVTGDIKYSPNNKKELGKINHHSNIYGHKCKVVLISQAGSEGIDFKNLRQVHILEPWYNLNRLEQITGRAIRNCSHKALPLEKRNCQIFLHTSYIDETHECTDMYIYRKCESKSYKIGKVQRVLKSISADCLLNHSQTSFSNLDQELDIQLSTGENIKHDIKDKPYSLICDYQRECEFKCANSITSQDKKDNRTFGYNHIVNLNMIENIKKMFTERSVYKREDLISYLNINNDNIESFYGALTHLIDMKQEFLIDKFGKKGNLTNIKDLYLFQPIEFTSYTTMYDKDRRITLKTQEIRVGSTDKTKRMTQRINAPQQKELASNELMSLLTRLKQQYIVGMKGGGSLKDRSSDFYVNYSLVIDEINLVTKKNKISDANKERFLIEKMMESLMLHEEYLLVQHLFHTDSVLDDLEQKYKLFYEYSYTYPYLNGTLLFLVDMSDIPSKSESGLHGVNSTLKILFKSKTENTFRYIKKSEIIEGPSKISEMLRFDQKHFYKYITFTEYNTKAGEFQPKIKNTEDSNRSKKSKGRFFINETPKKMIPVLDDIMQENVITKKGFSKEQLSIVLEIISKFKTQTENKIYYLNRVQNIDKFMIA